jgi:hypothetical protein
MIVWIDFVDKIQAYKPFHINEHQAQRNEQKENGHNNCHPIFTVNKSKEKNNKTKTYSTAKPHVSSTACVNLS